MVFCLRPDVEYRLTERVTSSRILVANGDFAVLSEADRELLGYLQGLLTHERRERFEQVLALRTRMLRVVLEDVYQPYNQSAVLRTAESLGLQDVHVIETSNRLKIARDVAMGCDRWLSIHRHQGADAGRSCLSALKAEGFRLLAASPHAPARPLGKICIDRPTALVIGHETEGLSDSTLSMVDECVVIPIRGFVESLNLSVAAAVALSHLRSQLEKSSLPWQLSPEETDRLRLEWTRRSISNIESIERRFVSDTVPSSSR